MADALVLDDPARFADWERQLSTADACTRPIRLRGRITAVDLTSGETATAYDTDAEPGHVLHVACGNRRETACPSCSAVYKRDARQLVRSGLVGGKGVPESVAEHPCVFATFTAPGFGPVHARRERNGKILPCRPRRDAAKRVCPHGRDISCPHRHPADDPRLGRPMCPGCYDYESAVVFNATAGDLWRRFTTYLPRCLAAMMGVTQKDLRSLVRLRFVKVAEYQARGVVHFHAIIRLDANTRDDDTYAPPPPAWSADVLAAAIQAAASSATVTADIGDTGRALLVRFGAQTDTKVVRSATADALSRNAVANYIAKYATKSAADAPGLPAYRLHTAAEVDALRCPPHYRRLIETAWALGYTQWAHCLGYGGHFLTKSRRFSVTFGHLRTARKQHRRAQRPDAELDPWGRQIDETTVLFIAEWQYAGFGYQASDVHALALMSADNARGTNMPSLKKFLNH
ncbi:MAG TPA: replication initiator [Trebonia sp.]